MDTDFNPRNLTIDQLLQVRDLLLELKLLRRRDLGPPNPHKPEEFWMGLDWTKSNTALAREHQLNTATISAWRHKLGHPNPVTRDIERRPPLQKGTKKSKLTDYSHLDFANKSDATLAKEMGVSRELMRQVRARLGLPRRTHWQIKFDNFKEHFKDRKELSFAQCRAEYPACPTETIFEDYCVRLGIEILDPIRAMRRWPWHLVDWRISNKMLAEIWDANPGVFSNNRSRLGKPKAEFAGMWKVVPLKWQPLVEEQKRVAAEWKASLKENPAPSNPMPG